MKSNNFSKIYETMGTRLGTCQFTTDILLLCMKFDNTKKERLYSLTAQLCDRIHSTIANFYRYRTRTI